MDERDERDYYNNHQKKDNLFSTTISTIVVQGGPLQLVIALLRVRISHDIKLWVVSISMPLKSLDIKSRLVLHVQIEISISIVGLRH